MGKTARPRSNTNARTKERSGINARMEFLQRGESVFEYKIDVPNAAEEYLWLLRSDAHMDHPQSDVPMQFKHLSEAREKGARVLDFGDLIDAMQGPNDKRRSPSAQPVKRDENGKIVGDDVRESYGDILIRQTTDMLAPHADLFDMICHGNHETGFDKYYGRDLTKGLVEALNRQPGNRIFMGHYSGFIKLSFTLHGSSRSSLLIYYCHGSGGGGPVTHGTIAMQRRQAKYNADIYLSGHIHRNVVLRDIVTTINDNCRLINRRIAHVNMPTYKDEYKGRRMGWAAEREMGERPIGAVWMKIHFELDPEIKGYIPIVDFLEAT